jgi:hypothetical protein
LDEGTSRPSYREGNRGGQPVGVEEEKVSVSLFFWMSLAMVLYYYFFCFGLYPSSVLLKSLKKSSPKQRK